MTRRVLRFAKENQDIFEDIKEGRKTVETRAGSPNYAKIQVGDELIFVCDKNRFTRRVRSVRHFSSVDDLLTAVDIKKIFVDRAATAEEAKVIYDSFPGYRERIAAYGLLAFEIISTN